ncbi:MAG: DUF3108 domain-containing protein [Chthoniobacterales bacterium]
MPLKSHFCFLGIFFAALSAVFAEDWESTVSPYAPGSFGEPKPVHLQYGFGWSNIIAATADLHFTKADGHYRLEGSGATTSTARALWKFDGKHSSLTDAHTLLPIQVRETESERNKTLEMEVNFTSVGASSRLDEHRGANIKTKTRSFDFPHLMSLSSALFYLRSQPLADGAVERIVVYPATAAYLCTIKVSGREHLTVPAGSYDAIKLDLQLNKIGKNHELKPHKKFRRASVWISNDNERMVLRIEAQIFIGTVFAELQSVQFDNAKP